MKTNICVAGISVALSMDNDIASFFLKRVHNTKRIIKTPDVTMICERVNKLSFTDKKFLTQQEPDIGLDYLYREIIDLGVFKYSRKDKVLSISYLVSDKYPFNSFEVVVDTMLQFVYLIMLDFNIIPLHASVVTYNNIAILIFGNSGSGKTTLELSLLKSGFKYFSDDIAFLDKKGTIYNSGEQILACSNTTMEIIGSVLGSDCIYGSSDCMTGKRIIRVPENMLSTHNEVKPQIILFPSISNGNIEILEQISNINTLVELIRLSVSKQFSVLQKQQYLKFLKILSEMTVAFRYHWTNCGQSNLSEVCCKVKDMVLKMEAMNEIQ